MAGRVSQPEFDAQRALSLREIQSCVAGTAFSQVLLLTREVQGGRLQGCKAHNSLCIAARVHLTKSFLNVVLHKSILTQIRHLIFHVSESNGQVDGFVGELTSAK